MNHLHCNYYIICHRPLAALISFLNLFGQTYSVFSIQLRQNLSIFFSAEFLLFLQNKLILITNICNVFHFPSPEHFIENQLNAWKSSLVDSNKNKSSCRKFLKIWLAFVSLQVAIYILPLLRYVCWETNTDPNRHGEWDTFSSPTTCPVA